MPATTQDILFFLFSSVLVSADTSSQKKFSNIIERRRNSEHDLETAGTDDAEDGQLGVAPILQPIAKKWTLWFEKKSEENSSKCLKKEDYLHQLKKGGTFQDISSFWKCWNEVQNLDNTPIGASGTNFHLFKNNIKPVWEDPKNIKGGKWIIVFSAKTSQHEVMKHWISFMLALVLGELGVESEINGAVLSVRSWGGMISIWNRNSNDKRLIEENLKKYFGVESIKYQRHQTNMRRNTQRAKVSIDNSKRSFYGSSSDEYTSNSSDSSSEGEQEKSIRLSVNKKITSPPSPPSELISEVISIPIPKNIKEAAEEKQETAESPDIKEKNPKNKIRESKTNSTPLAINEIATPLITAQEKIQQFEEVKTIQVFKEEKRIPLGQQLKWGLIFAFGVAVSAFSWVYYLE